MIKKLFILIFFLFNNVSFATFYNINYNTNKSNTSNYLDSLIIKNDSFIKTVNNRIFFDKNKVKITPKSIDNITPIDSTTNAILTLARGVFDSLEINNKYIDFLTTDHLYSLPVGIKKQIGGTTYIMGILKADIEPEVTNLTAFVKIILPETDTQGHQKELFFGATGIHFSHQGGIIGDAKLTLLGDVPIAFGGYQSVDTTGVGTLLVLRGGFDMTSGNLQNKTYVTIDCDGFKELSLNADILFSRNLLDPVDANNNIISDETVRVTGHFETVASSWNDILAQVNISKFQIHKDSGASGLGKGGFIFDISNAFIDFSDIRNHDNFTFPNDYSQYLTQGHHELWKGVFISQAQVILPEQFKRKNSNDRITFNVSNLLIDNLGVTGEFSVDNILSLEEGIAKKWQFSVDHIEANFLVNNLQSAGFNGKIVLPLTKKVTLSQDSTTIHKKALNYQAIINPGDDNYALTVQTLDTLSFDIFKAKATLFPNSYVELKVHNKRFNPKAVLHGSMEIAVAGNSNNNNKTIDFKGVEFHDLNIQTDSLSVGYLGYTGSVKVAGFPVTLSDIHATLNNNTASLHFNVALNMMENGFTGNTGIDLVAVKQDIDGYQRWNYDHFDISDIQINAEINDNLKLQGVVRLMQDDPTYGDGFYGQLSAEFSSINISASAWFGKTTFRYWYVDAFADLSGSQVPVKLGPIDITGFGGGAYYRMSKTGGTSLSTPSGLDYQPDANAGLGFRAMLGYAFQNKKAVNGRLAFEMAFNNNGGLNRILFYGSAHIMQINTPIDANNFKDNLQLVDNAASNNETDLVQKSKNQFPHDPQEFSTGINAFLGMEMNFTNHCFDAQLETYINVAGGVIRGSNEHNLAGVAVMHIDQQDWYLNIGTPSQRFGISFGLGSLSINTSAYFMIGTNIPGSPPPRQEVIEILHLTANDLDSMRDLNLLGEGRGFAMGMSIDVDTGDMTFLIFYAHFQAGLGFDVMIKDYGETACQDSGQIGINGWYANGQAYAYLQGSIGIRVKLFMIDKRVNILSGSAAVLLQAKLPNPSWFRGYVGVDYDVLGLVKGHCRFKLELGHECEVVGGNPLGGLKIISEIKPNDGGNQVDVFTKPQATFNMKVNHAFNFEDDNDHTKVYKIQLQEFEVSHQGSPISGHLEWNDTNDVVNFVSDDILPENDSIQVRVKVIFKEKNGNNWHTVMSNGQPAEEVESVSFTTGPAPNYIPMSNVQYCYPIPDQKYFYINERTSGYIKLIQGQPNIFPPLSDMIQKVEVTGSAGSLYANQVSYDAQEHLVHFDLPQGMQTQTLYTLKILSFTPQQNSSQPNDVTYNSVASGDDDTTIEVKNVAAQDVVQTDLGEEVVSLDFTSSQFGTFAEKMQAKTGQDYFVQMPYAGVFTLDVDALANERFGLTELQGNAFTNNEALIKPYAILDDAYYTQTIYPLLYQNYPIQNTFTVDRTDVDTIGVPPERAVLLMLWYPDKLQNDPGYSLLDTRLPFEYRLPIYYYDDFIDIRTKLTNAYLNSGNTTYDYIINTSFPEMPMGTYKVRYEYVLPGNITGSHYDYIYKKTY